MKAAAVSLCVVLLGTILALAFAYFHLSRGTFAVCLTIVGPALAASVLVTALALLSPGEVPV